MRCGTVLVALFLSACAAHRSPTVPDASVGRPAEAPRPPRFSVPPSDVEVLLVSQSVLHAAEIFTTAYDLSIGEGRAREANPLLASLTDRPIALSAVSGAIDVLQVYAVMKLHRTHPKIARWWALAMVIAETWATINNVNATSELQRQRAARSGR